MAQHIQLPTRRVRVELDIKANVHVPPAARRRTPDEKREQEEEVERILRKILTRDGSNR